MLDLALGLKRLGVEVGLLSTPVPPDYADELAAAGVAFHAVEGVTPGRYTPEYFRRVGSAVDEAAAERGYDLIHGQEFGLGLWRGSADPAIRSVLTVHGTMTSETALHPDLFQALSALGRLQAIRRYGRRLFFTPIWNRMMERAERVLVDSAFTRDELNRIRPAVASKVRLVPLGVEMSRYPMIEKFEARRELGWDESGPLQIVTVGRLEWQKGHDLAIEALARLRDLPWTYRIVGEGGSREELRAQVAGLQLSDRIHFTGRVDAETKSRMLAAADLFVWPERTHPAFGLVGLEAMLMNTPVLGAKRGAIPELIDGEGGWTCEAESVEALSEALDPLLRDPAKITAKAAGLRERALRRFQPEAMARGTLDVYRELADRTAAE